MIQPSMRKLKSVLAVGVLLGVAACGRVELGSDRIFDDDGPVSGSGPRPPAPEFSLGDVTSHADPDSAQTEPVQNAGPETVTAVVLQSPADAGSPDATPDASGAVSSPLETVPPETDPG
jgi:hypothetical protein